MCSAVEQCVLAKVEEVRLFRNEANTVKDDEKFADEKFAELLRYKEMLVVNQFSSNVSKERVVVAVTCQLPNVYCQNAASQAFFSLEI